MNQTKIVKKVWGEEHWLVNRDYCGKRLLLMKGFRYSTHFHKIKHETFYLYSGRILLELDGQEILMTPGSVQEIVPGSPHRFTGLEQSEIIEFSTHHRDEDSYRTTQSEKVPTEEFYSLLRRIL